MKIPLEPPNRETRTCHAKNSTRANRRPRVAQRARAWTVSHDMASHSGVVALGAPMALARGQGGVFRRNKRMGNYPSRFGASDSARILLPDRHCRRPIRVVPKATPGDDEGLSDDVTIKASINESSKMSLETELIEEIETTTTTSETVTTIVEDGVVVSTDILSNSDFDVSEGTVWKKKSEASMGSTSSSITSSVSSSKNGNAFGKTLTGFAKQAPELDENAIEKVSGAVAVGSASVVAVAFGSVAVGVTQALESVPILESFEQAVGLAVSAYYANKMSDNFLTATGREQFRLKLVENFTKVTGTESPVALAGKLARSDKELDAQIKGLIGELTVGTEENEKVLPEAVQNAISTFIRNRDGSVLSEIDSLRSVNENMRQQVDAIEMLQNELLEAKRETADARKNIKVMNLDEKEREKLESELRKARAEGEAMAEALRKEMADMAAKAATAAVAAEQALLREREQRQALETGEAVPPEGDVDFESSEQLDSAAKEKLARSAREIADFKEKLAKSKEWSDGVISGVDMNNEKDLQKALREAELRRERDLENAVRDSCDLVLEERRKAQALVKETEAYALEEITLAVRQARLEAKHSIEANKVETEEQFAEELAAKLSEATSAVAAELAARESELKTVKEEVDETKKQLLEAQRAASVSAQETELRVTNAVAAADAAAAALFEQKLATVTSELEAAAKEKLKATMADSLQELSLARAEANELRTQLDAISELASAKLANAMATAERALAEETKRANDAIAELKKMSKSSNETSSEMETRLEAELAEAKLATKKALEDMERFAAEAEAAKADAAEARRVSLLAEGKAKTLVEKSNGNGGGGVSSEEKAAMEKAVADARRFADDAVAAVRADLAIARQAGQDDALKVKTLTNELRNEAIESARVIDGLKKISDREMEKVKAENKNQLESNRKELLEVQRAADEAQRLATGAQKETETRVANAVAAAEAAAADFLEMRLENARKEGDEKVEAVKTEFEKAAEAKLSEKLNVAVADTLKELEAARKEAEELRAQMDKNSEQSSINYDTAIAKVERALKEEKKRANDAVEALTSATTANAASSSTQKQLQAELVEAMALSKKAAEDAERYAAEAASAQADAAEARRVSILAESKAKQLEEQSRASRNEGAYSREEVLAMEKAVADARKSADEAAASTAQAKADLATAKQSAEVYSAKVDELRVEAVETSKVIEGLKQISETGMENLRLENKKELERVLNVADLENKKRVQEAVSGKVRDLEAFKKESADVLKRAVAAAKADAETQLAKAVADADTKIVAAESKKRTELETKLAAAAAEMERRLSRAQADVETEREVATSARQDADRFSQKVSSLEQSLKDAELKLELADRTAIKAKNDVQDVSQRIETATKELSTKLTFTEQRLVNAQDAASRASESAEIFKTQLEKAEKEIANAAMNKTTSANDASLISDLSRKVATLELALLAAGAATARAEAEVNDAKSAVAETQNDTVSEEINALKLELALAQQRATDAERAADLLAEKLAAGGGSDAASDTPSGSSGGKALFDFSGVNVGGINLSYDDKESNTYALNIDTSKLSALTKMKKPALVEELNARRLPVTGIVAELRQRLRVARQEDKTSRSSTSKTSKNVGANESALKRPLSSYMLFAKEMRGDVLHASPGLSVGEVGKELGARWKSLSVGAKAEWELKSKELKTRYEVELSEARTKDALIESTTTSTTTSTSTSATSTKGTSYYQVINGNRYDRKVLDDCRAAMNNDDEIDLDEAKTILKDVYDGPVKMQKRGVMSSVTDVELATLRHAHYAFNWTTEADTFMFEELYDKMLGLDGVADVEETPASGSNYSKKSQTDRYYQTVEDGTRVDTTVLKQVEGKEVGLAEAKKIFENIQDSKKRTEQRGVGVKSKVTKVELQTIKYASVKFNWSAEAKAFVEGEIGGAVEGDMTIEEV